MIDRRRVEGVSRVVAYITRLIGENKTLKTIAVRGEVSNLSSQSGRLYFVLRERTDQLNCVAWSDAVRTLPAFRDGDEIIAEGDFTTYTGRSVYQLVVRSVSLTGIGALFAQVEELRKKFGAEGLFDVARKRPFPRFPNRVALVSARGKGAEDFLTTVARVAPNMRIEFVETRVQGDGAQMDIADAIDRASRLDVDIIVLARGGGSYEDLFAFNLEPVVRAIVRSHKPVMTAIGHTGDRHLADDVADRVAETPSNAAHIFGEIYGGFSQRLARASERLERVVREAVRARMQRLDMQSMSLARVGARFLRSRRERMLSLDRRLSARTPSAQLNARAQRLALLQARLPGAIRTEVKRARQRRELLAVALRAVDPNAPLQRGYAMIFDGAKLVRDAATVAPGTHLQARLQHGTLAVAVEGRVDE